MNSEYRIYDVYFAAPVTSVFENNHVRSFYLKFTLLLTFLQRHKNQIKIEIIRTNFRQETKLKRGITCFRFQFRKLPKINFIKRPKSLSLVLATETFQRPLLKRLSPENRDKSFLFALLLSFLRTRPIKKRSDYF